RASGRGPVRAVGEGAGLREPGGSHTLRESVRSRFTRSAQGTWVDVDPTLAVNADGSVSPRAGSFPLVLSGGGAGPVVRATQSGHTLALSWPGRLPAPVLTGSTATYVDVLPA